MNFLNHTDTDALNMLADYLDAGLTEQIHLLYCVSDEDYHKQDVLVGLLAMLINDVEAEVSLRKIEQDASMM